MLAREMDQHNRPVTTQDVLAAVSIDEQRNRRSDEVIPTSTRGEMLLQLQRHLLTALRPLLLRMSER